MKKFLLFFWDLFYRIRVFIKEKTHLILDYFYSRRVRPIKVMTIEETVDRILESSCSVARFGDGEIKLTLNTPLAFQEANEKLCGELKKTLSSHEEELLVCVPDIFGRDSLAQYNDPAAKHWKKHLSFYRRAWYACLDPDKVYGNAFISRPYNNYRDKSGCASYFSHLKKVWDGRDVVIAEGAKSRLGMGNDLLDNAASVRRVLCPVAQCYDRADEIVAEIEKFDKSCLILLAIGPTASVIPMRLIGSGYRVIDIGNIDTEYEWFRMGSETKVPIKDKMVYEAGAGADVGEATDEKYLSQIVTEIK